MRISKKPHQLVRQNEEKVRKPNKHDVNLQKNSTLYFQIGLIVCLLVTYGLLEMRFETKTIAISELLPPDDEYVEYTPDIYKVYEENAIEEEVKPKEKVRLPEDFEVVDNDKELLNDLEIITLDQNTTSDVPMDPTDLNVVEIIEDIPEPIHLVEQVPIYPGCENKKNNNARRKCMSDKINRLVRKRFNTSVGSDEGITGVQSVRVVFKINKEGEVSEVRALSKHPALRKEAERVVGKIPKMTPGKQSNKNVSVIYQLPISYQVQD